MHKYWICIANLSYGNRECSLHISTELLLWHQLNTQVTIVHTTSAWPVLVTYWLWVWCTIHRQFCIACSSAMYISNLLYLLVQPPLMHTALWQLYTLSPLSSSKNLQQCSPSGFVLWWMPFYACSPRYMHTGHALGNVTMIQYMHASAYIDKGSMDVIRLFLFQNHSMVVNFR